MPVLMPLLPVRYQALRITPGWARLPRSTLSARAVPPASRGRRPMSGASGARRAATRSNARVKAASPVKLCTNENFPARLM